ncbi:MAG: tandem-95 repeat protein [Nanoarchaeota archaeon]|nr:tandem-95 repeat protein [Nanoarchaeota archaeon]
MKSKTLISYCIILVLFSSFASATLDFTSVWSFQGNPVTGVRALNFECTNGACNPLGTNIFDQTSVSNSIIVPYTVPGPANGYGTYWVADCFVPQGAAFTPTADGAGSFNFDFTKKSACQSNILQFTGPASVVENQLATFTVRADSAFPALIGAPAGIPADTAVRNAHFSADTIVTFDVINASGSVVSTQTSNQVILLDNSNTVIFSFTPNFNQAGVYTVRARTSVPDCQCSSSFSLETSKVFTITDVNRAPVTTSDVITVLEDGSVNVSVLANDNDIDGDSLLVFAISQGTSGVVANNGGTVTYTPNSNFCGSDSFTYTATDGNGGTDSASVAVLVSCVNDAPVSNNDTASLLEDGSVSVAVLSNDIDVDGDALSVVAITQGSNGTVAILGQNTTYTPNSNFCGSDSFTYTATDGNGGTDSASVAVLVSCVNDFPVIDFPLPNQTFVQDSGFQDNVIDLHSFARDVDHATDELTFTILIQTGQLIVDCVVDSNRFIDCTPQTNQSGSSFIIVQVSDGSFNATSSFSVAVTSVVGGNGTGGNGSSGGGSGNGSINASVNAFDDVASTFEDTSVAITVLSNDVSTGNGSLSILSVSAAASGVASIDSTNVTYTPTLNFCGSDTFTYVAGAGNSSDSAMVSITVACVNDAPVASGESASTLVNVPVTINVLGNDDDVDGDTLSVELVTGASSGLVSLIGTNAVYTPNVGFVGVDSFTYRARDATTFSNTVSVTVTVTQANRAPVITSLPVTLLQQETDECCTPYRYDVEAFDPDGAVLTFSLLQAPSGMRINPVTGLITLDNPRDFGSFVVVVAVTDGTFIVTQTFSITLERARLDINPRDRFHITTIRTNQAAHSDVRPGEMIFVDLGFENLGRRDTKHATIRVTEYDLGISRKFGPFSGPDVGDAMSNGASIRIPEDARPGVYTLRITLSDTQGIRRVRHREFRIV